MSGRIDIWTRWTASCCGAHRYRGEQEVVGLSRSKYAAIAGAVLLVSAVVSVAALVTGDPHELVSMRLDVLNRAGRLTPLIEAAVSLPIVMAVVCLAGGAPVRWPQRLPSFCASRA